MKKIIIRAIISVIFCIIIIFCFIFIKTKKNNEDNFDIGVQDYNNDNEVMQKVDNRNDYIDVSQCVHRYFSFIRDNDAESLIKLLEKDYIKEKNITENNVLQKIYECKDRKLYYYIKDMRIASKSNINQYVVDCKVSNGSEEKNIFLIVLVDNTSAAFSILPINEKYTDITKVKAKENIVEIENIDLNNFNINTVDDGKICETFFKDFLNKAVHFPKDVYMSLDEEYRKERFKDYSDFQSFISKNKKRYASSVLDDLRRIAEFEKTEDYFDYLSRLDRIHLDKYLVENDENGKSYVCVDQNGCYYIFQENNIMDYILKLDTYTINSEKFKNAYKEGNDTKKCQLNIDKFFKMINNKDYTHAYNVLDDGFKNNYFKTQQDFEKFASSHFYEFNEIKFNNVSTEGEVYIFKITIIDIKNTSNSFDINVFIKLKDGMDFVMSFGKAE